MLSRKQVLAIGSTIILTAIHLTVMAQDGNAGINEAIPKCEAILLQALTLCMLLVQ